MIRKLLKEEKGSTIVMLALMSTVLLGMTALVVDYGLLSVQKHRLEIKSDAAALAGAQELPDVDAALAKAKVYAEKNGLELDKTQFSIGEDLKTVRVSSYKPQPLSFARVFNKNSSTVKGGARAKLSPIKKMWGAAPLGIDNRILTFGEFVSLKVAPENDEDYLLGSGNYGVLALSGVGASNYENDLKFGYQDSLTIGDIVELQTGNISGATQAGVNYRINQCNHIPMCTPEHFDRDCPMVITVPVYEINEVFGSNQVKNIKIIGFAAFLLDSFTKNGKYNFVNGYFVRTIKSGEYSETATDYGVNVPHLISW